MSPPPAAPSPAESSVLNEAKDKPTPSYKLFPENDKTLVEEKEANQAIADVSTVLRNVLIEFLTFFLTFLPYSSIL